MRLYYFVSAQHGLDDLKRQRLKIAQLDDMNDPFELLSLELSDPMMRRIYRSFVRDMALQFGVICFSRQWHNPVLWSHYADKHRGMCLGFDVSDQSLMNVNYRGARLPNKIKTDLDYGGLDENDVQEILTTKFNDWKYEKELRVFLRLEDRDTHTGLYFKGFSDDLALREIILGPRCAITKTEIAKHLKDFSGIRVIEARLAFKTFRVVRNKAVRY